MKLKLSRYFELTAPDIEQLIAVSIKGKFEYYRFTPGVVVVFSDDILASAVANQSMTVVYDQAVNDDMKKHGEKVNITKVQACCGGSPHFKINFNKVVNADE